MRVFWGHRINILKHSKQPWNFLIIVPPNKSNEPVNLESLSEVKYVIRGPFVRGHRYWYGLTTNQKIHTPFFSRYSKFLLIGH